MKTLTLSITVALGLVAPARAALIVWANAGEGDWNEPANWTGGVVPGSSDDARINNGGTALINSSQTVATGFAVMGDVTGTTGTLRMTGGMLTSNFDIRAGGNAATGGGTGIFDQSGGVVFMNGGNLNVGFGTTAVGTYNLSDGSLQVNSATIFAVGNRGIGTVNQSGGTIYVRGLSAPGTSVTQLGRNVAAGTGFGTYNLSGGTLLTARLQYGNAVGVPISTNVFNLLGTGALIVGHISVLNTTASNSFNFTGGTLSVMTNAIPLNNQGGTLSPATVDFVSPAGTSIEIVPINPIGTTFFTGANSYRQEATGTLAIDIAGLGNNDFVDIGAGAPVGNATLAGTIAVHLLNNFNPAPGSTFDVLTADSISSSAAVTGTTPPGDSFVPSIVTGGDGRQVLRLTVTTVVTPPVLLNPMLTGEGRFQFEFTSAPGALFTALTTTDVTLPLHQWSVVGPVAEISPGHFQFTSAEAVSGGHRFYAVRSP